MEEKGTRMKILQFVVSTMLMASVASTGNNDCDDVFLVNDKGNVCLETGLRDNIDQEGFLMHIRTCNKNEKWQKFSVQAGETTDDGDPTFKMFQQAGSGNAKYYIYLNKDDGALARRLRLKNGNLNNAITEFVYTGEGHINPAEYEDFCVTGRGAAQNANEHVIVLQCTDDFNERFDWHFTKNPEDSDDEFDLEDCL